MYLTIKIDCGKSRHLTWSFDLGLLQVFRVDCPTIWVLKGKRKGCRSTCRSRRGPRCLRFTDRHKAASKSTAQTQA
jgi:hypothetical protein